MPAFDWQLLITLIAISLAAGYVIVSFRRFLAGGTGCGSRCGGCGSGKSPPLDTPNGSLSVVTLSPPPEGFGQPGGSEAK